MTGAAVVSVLVLLVAGSQAILFGRGNPTATSDGRPVDPECLSKAAAGSCDFYSCFEQRLPCGAQWYILRQGHYYCLKMNRLRSTFTPAGQAFLDNAKQCLTQSLAATYQLDYINCHQLEHNAVDQITPCFTQHGFCDVVEGDATNFFNLYELTDLISRGATKMWREVTSLLAQCTQQRINAVSTSARERIVNAFNSIFQRK